jgi:hypothetical protein
MRKIDKSTILSTNYKAWVESLKEDNHPEYRSNHKYYRDIKMSLLYCQKGLCAYTEQMLCDATYLGNTNWHSEGDYRQLSQDEWHTIQGDLEHFDESLKANNGWAWDNLFVVDSHVNCRIKRSNPIKNILKPDSDDYDPSLYLTFDSETGIFSAKGGLSATDKDDVEYMITTLGLNCIADERKRQIKQWLDMREMSMGVNAYRYITAWAMTIDE